MPSFTELDSTLINNYYNSLPDNINKDEFIEVIKQSNAIVSGSRVLHAILNPGTKNWESMDIDIYINKRNSGHILKYLKDNFTMINKAKNYPSDTYKYSMNQSALFEVIYFKNIDLIILKDEESIQNFVANFDLTCCRNYIDFLQGKIYALYPEHINKMEAIMNIRKFSSYDKNNLVRVRFNKYAQRGFKISMC